MVHEPNTSASPAAPAGDRLLTLERLVSALAMAGICFISFANVVARYVSNYSFAFTEEYSVFLMVLLTFVGSSAAIARRAHMRVALFAERGPWPWRRLCRIGARLASLVMFGLIVWYGARLTWDQYRFEELSAGLGVPTWIYTLWMPLVALLMCGRFLYVWWQEDRAGR
ncbi:MAG: TRAP transporter small permease [Hyphomicrobiaceae bacterium]|nr:TRAP transporter small permease [Hyphomicrobiaceae bacterium]